MRMLHISYRVMARAEWVSECERDREGGGENAV